MIGVGIIGLGTVGAGTYRILTEHKSLIQEKTGLDIKVVRIAETDPQKVKGKRIAGSLITSDALEILNDTRIDIVVELIGGIRPAYDYIVNALKKKKWVVTANKALLAERGDKLFQIAGQNRCEIGFEASVCGGIPVIRAIRDGLIGNRVTYMLGILNGTSNYILTKMTDDGVSFDDALRDAQRLGFAEKDPTFDIEGIDAAHKLAILVRLAFSYPIRMADIITGGISRIEPIDIDSAKEFGYRIKLLAVARDDNGLIEARVEPAMIPLTHPMSNVHGVYNAVYVVGDKVGPNLFYGRGAGGEPTGSAVVSDIIDMAHRIQDKNNFIRLPVYTSSKKMKKGEESSVPYYMRFTAQDRPGVLSKISGILAQYNISISAVTQKGRKETGHVPIVMLTHEAVEHDLKKAKAAIDRLSIVRGGSIYIRIEEGGL
ncbi:MAG: homoserine dehydrogenase [Syntrophorhabdaceae bacterium]|nr:homoserine dehydrogenase [Syntrophorhabdaceae bacterium]